MTRILEQNELNHSIAMSSVLCGFTFNLYYLDVRLNNYNLFVLSLSLECIFLPIFAAFHPGRGR